MADNYLEKRMEELRSGKLSNSARKSAGPRKGFVNYPFPEKRVLVIGGVGGIGLAVVNEYLKTGCRVAVFDCDKEKGERLALSHGVRFHPMDPTDEESAQRQLRNLLKAWRDIDIVVCTSPEQAAATAMEWELHKQKYPIPSDYGGRFITIGFTDKTAGLRLKKYGIISGAILTPSDEQSDMTEYARACIFMSLPATTHPWLLEIN